MASASIDVYVKLPTGKAIPLQHLPTDTVRSIAGKIAESESVPEQRVLIKYQGKTLDKTKTISYLGICAETILKVEVLVPKDLTISIVLPEHEDFECMALECQTTDTVRRLKEAIQDITEIPTSHQRIKVDGVIMDRDLNMLCEYGITMDCTVSVLSRTPAPIETMLKEEDQLSDEEVKEGLLNTFDGVNRPVEVVFCFDTTGSMYSCLDMVRTKLRECCQRLLGDIPHMRIGLMAVGDYCDYTNYVVSYADLTSDVNTLVEFSNVTATTGGDSPEAYEWALRKAQQMDWSEDSAKAFILIGDEVPHSPRYTDQNIFWQDELDVLIGMGIKVYGVQALDVTNAEPFYRELAERSGGFYLQLKSFDLITVMFQAVCYREADDGQLDAFVDEVEKDGKMTENTKLFLDELDDKTETAKEKAAKKDNTESPKRYVAEPWWDPSLSGRYDTIMYTYNSEKDQWRGTDQKTPMALASPILRREIRTSSRTRRSVAQRFLSIFKSCSSTRS